jgi:hypothetical protein
MNVKRQVFVASAVSLALLCQANSWAQTREGSFEAPPTLSVAELLPAIQRDGHPLISPVGMEGYRAIFEIGSPQGSFRAAGTELLSLRIAELPAIENLRRINKSEAFADALGKAAKAPLAFVGNAFSDPGAALRSVASGVGQLVETAGSAVNSGVERVTDGISDMTGDTAKPLDASSEPAAPSFISDPFGYNKARRLWAKTLAVDPYTSNPQLRQLLDDAASASFAGSFAIDATLGIVAAPVKLVVGFDAQSQDMVWDLSPGDIQSQLTIKLGNMGIEGRPVRDFFRNPGLTPSLQTGLVSALEKLNNVAGRGAAIDLASRMQGEANLRGFIEALNLLADHHLNTAPLADLRPSTAMLVTTRKDGELLVAVSADYFFWDAAAAALANRADLAAPRRTILVSGRASARARQELERAGWAVSDATMPRLALSAAAVSLRQ